MTKRVCSRQDVQSRIQRGDAIRRMLAAPAAQLAAAIASTADERRRLIDPAPGISLPQRLPDERVAALMAT